MDSTSAAERAPAVEETEALAGKSHLFAADYEIPALNEEGSMYFTDDEVNTLNCAMSVALYSTDYWSFLAK
ncbi:MAG: hypothetical protein MJZ39_00250 [Bacteroidales bacterium]|nr:hypothetical protein [Bacteroidales bacterium]